MIYVYLGNVIVTALILLVNAAMGPENTYYQSLQNLQRFQLLLHPQMVCLTLLIRYIEIYFILKLN